MEKKEQLKLLLQRCGRILGSECIVAQSEGLDKLLEFE